MRKKAIRVFLTEGCNANCINCFNKDARDNTEMNPDEFASLCKYLKISGFNVLKVMGGEPTTHSQFQRMISIAQNYFPRISIFTNALNEKIISFNPREDDTVVYNMNFESSLTEEKLLLLKKGKRTLKYQISPETDINKIKNSILYWRTISEKIKPSFTYDCTTDIFVNREILLSKTRELEEWLKSSNIHYGFDHKLPICFYKDMEEAVDVSYPSGRCNVETSGLIDSRMNLRYCNQHHDILIHLKENNSFIPWSIIKNYLLLEFYKLQIEILESGCIKCVLYGSECNSGCWGKSTNRLPFLE